MRFTSYCRDASIHRLAKGAGGVAGILAIAAHCAMAGACRHLGARRSVAEWQRLAASPFHAACPPPFCLWQSADARADDAPMAPQLWHDVFAVLGTLAAGFLGGAAAWFATNFWGRPIAKFFELRLQAQETILFHANIGPHLADAERLPRASDELRRIAAQIGGVAATSPPVILWLLRRRGYDLTAATENLIGLSNTLMEPYGSDHPAHRELTQRALRLPVVPSR
jgi:hypothetical protein